MKLLSITDFALLQPGDELVIKAGCPYVDLTEDRTVIVAAVSGFSFLTADGLCIGGCWAEGHVFATGIRHTDFQLSPAAQAILEQSRLSEAD